MVSFAESKLLTIYRKGRHSMRSVTLSDEVMDNPKNHYQYQVQEALYQPYGRSSRTTDLSLSQHPPICIEIIICCYCLGFRGSARKNTKLNSSGMGQL